MRSERQGLCPSDSVDRLQPEIRGRFAANRAQFYDVPAGPAFFDAAVNGIQDAIASVQKSPADIRSAIVVML